MKGLCFHRRLYPLYKPGIIALINIVFFLGTICKLVYSIVNRWDVVLYIGLKDGELLFWQLLFSGSSALARCFKCLKLGSLCSIFTDWGRLLSFPICKKILFVSPFDLFIVLAFLQTLFGFITVVPRTLLEFDFVQRIERRWGTLLQ